MDYLLVRLHSTLYKRVEGPIYVGAGFHFDSYDNIVDHRAEEGESTPFTEYSGGAPATTNPGGFSLNFLGDTRDNLVNPRKGYLLTAASATTQRALGADDGWQELLLDVRLYTNIPQNKRTSWPSGIRMAVVRPGPLPQPAGLRLGYLRAWRARLPAGADPRRKPALRRKGKYRMELTKDGLLGAVGFVNATFTTIPEITPLLQGRQSAASACACKFNKKSDTNLVSTTAGGARVSGAS
jgi:hypothetical protein